MRILVLSFYYPPDIGPGSLRAKSIVDAIIKEAGNNVQVEVITTMPNRYQSLNTFALERENNSKVNINRINLPSHRNGMFDQTRAFILFVYKVKKLISNKNWDIVVATSSRLMTASLGAWIAKQTGSKLYLDIRDLFTDTMNSVLAKKPLYILMPFLLILEKWTFKSCDMLNLVSAGFLNHFKKITPNLSPSVYTNGVDKMFLKNNFSNNETNSKPLILYTGNIGDGQGLHNIIPKAANELEDIQFRLIGDGGERNLLIDNVLQKSLINVEILKPVMRHDLLNEYKKADILFLHLNNYEAFQKVLPSKIFEYAATGKPILAGVSGYAAKFLADHVEGVEIFHPCDLESMKHGLQKLLNGPKIIDRKNFCLNFSREKIMKKLAKDILSLS